MYNFWYLLLSICIAEMNQHLKQLVNDAYAQACKEDRFNFDVYTEELSLSIIKQCALIALIEQQEPFEAILNHFEVEISYND